MNNVINSIDSFQGSYRWLSNFWLSPITMEDGVCYPSVEHAFQAHKTAVKSDRLAFAMKEDGTHITPGQAKRRGRFLILRRNWDILKLGVMQDALALKFRIPWLRERLLNTGDGELIEGNTWGDTYWGVCRGRGENNLGKLLMQVRQELREQ